LTSYWGLEGNRMEKIERRLLRRPCEFFSKSKQARKYIGLTIKKE